MLISYYYYYYNNNNNNDVTDKPSDVMGRAGLHRDIDQVFFSLCQV